eukprot:EC096247.1.p2 GENE.EC096247.1~~EC096247.1.p2  ORF type:complete len:168 (-),score=3.67 EC096247.1:1-504(-)
MQCMHAKCIHCMFTLGKKLRNFFIQFWSRTQYIREKYSKCIKMRISALHPKSQHLFIQNSYLLFSVKYSQNIITFVQKLIWRFVNIATLCDLQIINFNLYKKQIHLAKYNNNTVCIIIITYILFIHVDFFCNYQICILFTINIAKNLLRKTKFSKITKQFPFNYLTY